MLTYKKRPGDPATSSIKDKDILRALWFDWQGRMSPSLSDVEEEETQDIDTGFALNVEGKLDLNALYTNVTEGDEKSVLDNGFI